MPEPLPEATLRRMRFLYNSLDDRGTRILTTLSCRDSLPAGYLRSLETIASPLRIKDLQIVAPSFRQMPSDQRERILRKARKTATTALNLAGGEMPSDFKWGNFATHIGTPALLAILYAHSDDEELLLHMTRCPDYWISSTAIDLLSSHIPTTTEAVWYLLEYSPPSRAGRNLVDLFEDTEALLASTTAANAHSLWAVALHPQVSVEHLEAWVPLLLEPARYKHSSTFSALCVLATAIRMKVYVPGLEFLAAHLRNEGVVIKTPSYWPIRARVGVALARRDRVAGEQGSTVRYRYPHVMDPLRALQVLDTYHLDEDAWSSLLVANPWDRDLFDSPEISLGRKLEAWGGSLDNTTIQTASAALLKSLDDRLGRLIGRQDALLCFLHLSTKLKPRSLRAQNSHWGKLVARVVNDDAIAADVDALLTFSPADVEIDWVSATAFWSSVKHSRYVPVLPNSQLPPMLRGLELGGNLSESFLDALNDPEFLCRFLELLGKKVPLGLMFAVLDVLPGLDDRTLEAVVSLAENWELGIDDLIAAARSFT